MAEIGDKVWVPHWAGYSWLPYRAKIKRTTDSTGRLMYAADLPIKRLTMNEDWHLEEFLLRPQEIFDDLSECSEYIKNYFYDGLCSGCSYHDKCGDIWACRSCAYRDRHGHCSQNNLDVGLYTECCNKFAPKREADQKDFVSWEHYEDILRNCEFNPQCRHHKESAHHTCTYEHYLNELIRVRMMFPWGERTVKAVLVPRRMWFDQSFKDGDTVKCHGLIFEPLLTPTGKLKKNAVNFEAFDKLAEINTGA